MDKIADFLIEKETITGKEFMKIFRQVKGIPEPEEEIRPEKKRMGGAPVDPGGHGTAGDTQGIVRGCTGNGQPDPGSV